MRGVKVILPKRWKLASATRKSCANGGSRARKPEMPHVSYAKATLQKPLKLESATQQGSSKRHSGEGLKGTELPHTRATWLHGQPRKRGASR